MLLNAGKLNVEDLLGGNSAGKKILSIGVGTSNAPESPTDSALTGAVIKAVTTVNYLSGGIVQFETTLLAGDPAMTIQEVGLYNVDGLLCHRKVIPSRTKTAGVSAVVHYNVKIV